MAMIEATRDVMTLVNVFTVDPGRQAELVKLLLRATEDTMRHIDGFVSASIHRGVDGSKVVNYAQWRDQRAFEAMQKHPEARKHMEAAAALATFEPIVCEVVESIDVASARLP